LLATQQELERKKEKLGIIDSPEEIALLHRLLGNFVTVYPTLDLAQKQRAFSLLVNRIEVKVVSPHWLRLSIDWLDAICPRIDIAYLWRVSPGHEPLSDQEKEMIKQHYPCSSQLEMLRLLPKRTWAAIQAHARLMHVKRQKSSDNDIPQSVCYRDMIPNLDEKYLFGDYETTHDCGAMMGRQSG